MTLLYWEWHFIPRWLFRSIFAQFPEQHLNGLVSWGSPGKYSMIVCFLVAVGPFWEQSASTSRFGVLFCHVVLVCWYTAGLLFPRQYLCGTILVTQYSMVWNSRVPRAGPMPFYWPSCSLTFRLLLFSLSLLSFYGLVVWDWGLRTDRVLIALSQPCITNLF